jgi:transposase
MAKATGLNQTAISRIWRAFALKPHLVDDWKLSIDPQFIEKVRDIVGLSLDDYGTHKTPQIHQWLVKHSRFHLHVTPTYSSWLNIVERWFAELTNRKPRNHSQLYEPPQDGAPGQHLQRPRLRRRSGDTSHGRNGSRRAGRP